MKKVLLYLLIIALGSVGVYYGLTKYNNNDNNTKLSKYNNTNEEKDNNDIKEKDTTEIIPSRDGFISEAIKLQTLAENKNSNESCVCYNVKELDKNTSLSGSILVYTNDDLFLTSMWLGNGYYLVNGVDSVATDVLEESSEEPSLYCGETSADIKSSLCTAN